MRIEIWSDIVSPFCYFGRRQLEAALADFAHRDAVELIYRSFELDPDAPLRGRETLLESLMAKTGQSREQIATVLAKISEQARDLGLSFRLEQALPVKTFEAHRLLYHAAAQGMQSQALERLQRAYFCEGAELGEPENLIRLLGETGLDPIALEQAYITGAYEHEVNADIHEALIMGVTSLPYVMIDGQHALTGSQPAEVCLAALEKAWQQALIADMAPPKAKLRSSVSHQRRSLPRKRKK